MLLAIGAQSVSLADRQFASRPPPAIVEITLVVRPEDLDLDSPRPCVMSTQTRR
jgi:hypothetical protein